MFYIGSNGFNNGNNNGEPRKILCGAQLNLSWKEILVFSPLSDCSDISDLKGTADKPEM